MFPLGLAIISTFFIAGYECGNFTVTKEAWFEVEIKGLDGPGEDYHGKFTIALFGETVPMTVLNFVSIAKGFKTSKQKLHYKGTKIHRVVPDFVIQMGDVTKGDGTGGASIFGPKFNDENFILSHRSPGWVSMANHGSDTNGSQFFILMSKARWLNKKHVVFGKVIRGMDVLNTINELETIPNTASPRKTVKIVDCGVDDVTFYDLKPSQLDTIEDIETPSKS